MIDINIMCITHLIVRVQNEKLQYQLFNISAQFLRDPKIHIFRLNLYFISFTQGENTFVCSI